MIFVSSSCTSTRIAELINSSNEIVELYTTIIPEKEYIEICYIQTDGAVFHTPQQPLIGLKKKAALLKADAVVNIKYDFQGWYFLVSGTTIKYK